MIRESFWHKTLFTNQPNEDVSIYSYLTIFLCWHIKIKPKCSVSLSGKRPYEVSIYSHWTKTNTEIIIFFVGT